MGKVAHPRRDVKRPRIGPCRDPLYLWFLEWEDERGVWRRYFEDRDMARRALSVGRIPRTARG